MASIGLVLLTATTLGCQNNARLLFSRFTEHHAKIFSEKPEVETRHAMMDPALYQYSGDMLTKVRTICACRCSSDMHILMAHLIILAGALCCCSCLLQYTLQCTGDLA